MRLWITRDKEGLCLWRAKPALNEDGVWWEDNEDFIEITPDIYFTLTNWADITDKAGIIEIDVNLVPPSVQQSESKECIKTRRHK